MGYSPSSIRKGVTAEYLAKAHFSKLGYSILNTDTHETPYDFIVQSPKQKTLQRVQVKAAILTSAGLVRLRNKHGNKNASYQISDYDILAGVWVEENLIYLFKSEEINLPTKGETITVATIQGRPLRHSDIWDRSIPYYAGPI